MLRAADGHRGTTSSRKPRRHRNLGRYWNKFETILSRLHSSYTSCSMMTGLVPPFTFPVDLVRHNSLGQGNHLYIREPLQIISFKVHTIFSFVVSLKVVLSDHGVALGCSRAAVVFGLRSLRKCDISICLPGLCIACPSFLFLWMNMESTCQVRSNGRVVHDYALFA